MKRGISLALLVIAFGSFAFAANTRAKGKNKIAQVATAPPAQNKNLASAGALPESTVEQAPIHADEHAQTSTASIPEVTAAAKPKKFSLMIDSWNYVPVYAADVGNGDITALNTYRIDYKVADSKSVGVAMINANSWGSTSEGKSNFKFLDPYIRYADSKIAVLPAELKLQGNVRFYPGLSEASRMKTQYGSVRLDLSIKKEIGAITLGYNTISRYMLQTDPSYNDATGKRAINTQAVVEHFLSFEAVPFKNASFYQNLGVDEMWHRSDAQYGLSKNRQQFLYAETGLGYNITPEFTLVGGLSSWQERDLLDQKNEFGIYRNDENTYFLEGTVVF